MAADVRAVLGPHSAHEYADPVDRSNAPSPTVLSHGHVPRPRLAAAASAGTGITCVIGGAGWGKSVVLRELCEAAAGPVLVVALGDAPSTAASLWDAVTRAATELLEIDVADLTTRQRHVQPPEQLRAAAPADPWFGRDVADRLSEMLTGDAPAMIVVDDLHHVERDALRAWWAFVERISNTSRIVMASRHERSFPLSVWRLRDDVHVVDEADLAFDADETQLVLGHVLGADVPEDLVRSVIERTDGWPLGVRHHAASVRRTSRTPDAAPDAEEVLLTLIGELSPELRRFVSDVCVLTDLTIAACHRLSGRSDAGALLHELARSSTFTVAHDVESSTHRLRRPFRELLLRQLRDDEPERWDALHRRASEHHLERGAVGTAASHLVDIGDHSGALSLLLQHHATVMEMAQHLELPSLLERVPMPVVRSDARRTFALGFLLATSGQLLAGRRVVDTLHDADLEPELRRRVRWVRLLIACSLGDASDADLEAPPLDPPDPSVAMFWRELPIALVLDDRLAAADEVWAQGVRWGIPASTDALLHTATEIFLGAWRGRIRDVIPDTTEAEEDLTDARNRPRAAHVRIAITRAMIDAELGDPMEAIAGLERAAEEFEGRIIPFTTHDVPLLRTLVRTLRLAGRPDLALARGLEHERAIDRSRPRVRRLVSEEIVRSACATGALDIAVHARGELEGPCSPGLADAWIAIARGDLFAARSAVAGFDVADLMVRAPSRALDVLDVRARAASSGREREDLVAAAARLADEHGLRRSFATGIGAVSAATDRILGRRPERETPPLSDRELDVLRGLASGVSHRLLAAELEMSHNTLKTHLRAVYRKLGALDRNDAVLRARTAGLLSSAVADPVGR